MARIDRAVLFGTVAAVCACATVAEAQAVKPAPSAAELEEIVVTARKREEQLADVPASVSAFSGEQVEALGGLTDVKELSYVAPGVALVDTGNINSEINIRGAGAGTARVAGVDAPIGVLRNGVNVAGGNIGGRTYTRADMFDVARIEIVRGPQGALYGVNSVGGVLNVLSRRPSDSVGAKVSAGWTGKTERRQGEAIVNVPLGDKLALRIGGQTAKADGGQFYNSVTSKYGDIERYWGVRASALWTPTDDLTVYLVTDSSSEWSPSNRIKTVYALNDRTAQPGPTDPDGPFVYGQNTPNVADRDLVSYTAQVDWNTPLGAFTSISSYRQRDTTFLQDEDGSAPGYSQAAFPAPSCVTRSCISIFTDDTEMRSQEFRLSNTFNENIDWMVGANWQYRQTDFAFISEGRTNNNLTTLSPTANAASVALDKDEQIGLFGTLSWSPTERISLDAAVRWGRSDKSGYAYNVRRGAGPILCPYLDPIHGDLAATTGCVALPISFDERFENTSPSLAVKYDVSDTANVFATVARGYRSGGFNGTAVSFPGTVPPAYGAEKTTAYEVGTKLRVVGGLLTATAFRNDFDDYLVSLPIPGDLVGRSYRNNAGKAETHGVDLEWAGRATLLPQDAGRLDLLLGLNWLDGEIKRGPYRGRTVEGSPEYTYTAVAIYSRQLAMGWRFSASTSYRRQRGGFTNTTQINNLVPLDDLDLWSARVALEARGLEFALSAENLFDDTYVALKDPNRSVYGDRREVTLKVTYRFGSEARGPK